MHEINIRQCHTIINRHIKCKTSISICPIICVFSQNTIQFDGQTTAYCPFHYIETDTHTQREGTMKIDFPLKIYQFFCYKIKLLVHCHDKKLNNFQSKNVAYSMECVTFASILLYIGSV